MKKIYSSKPLSYRQWGQIKKEMYRLALCVAALIALEMIIHAFALAVAHYL